jgi:hypothetical protein
MRLRRRVEKEIGHLDVHSPVEVITASQSVSDALATEAKTAALLVVGSRELGGCIGPVMGSVTQHCLHDSPACW